MRRSLENKIGETCRRPRGKLGLFRGADILQPISAAPDRVGSYAQLNSVKNKKCFSENAQSKQAQTMACTPNSRPMLRL